MGFLEKDFDKEYIDQMVSDHAKALSAFTSEAKDTKDVKFQAAVIKGKTAVAAHKNMAYDLKKVVVAANDLQRRSPPKWRAFL